MLPDVVPHDKVYQDIKQFYVDADRAFHNTAIRCWIAAAMYGLVLLFSFYKLRVNRLEEERQLSLENAKRKSGVTAKQAIETQID